MSIRELAAAIKGAIDRRVNEEARAKRGTIRDGMFHCGSKTYPFKQAVDCKTNEGNKVWAQLSPTGHAVIVGE